jgi:aryl sulfotransferase
MRGGIWWLASYPKSGNTWLRAILATLVSGKPVDINAMAFLGPHAASRSRFDRALGVDSASLSDEQEFNLRPRVYEILAAEAERPLYCKTHDACLPTPAGEPLFPTAATRGAVYVVRDPRAVAVSSVHFMARSIDETIAAMDNPMEVFAGSTQRLSQHLRQPLRRWCEHVESWLAAPFPVHLMRYEDMLADPHAAVLAMAEFLGLPVSEATVATAVEATGFSRLQAQERATGFAESPRHAAAFFREGRADGWRRVLTPAQADRIVAGHGQVMRRLGYDVTLAPLPQAIAKASEPAILALNNAHAVELSCLDAERLASLTGQAFYACAIGEVGAFLLAFDQTAAYDSPNYLWFRERYPRFVYVDRVVVAPPLRGRGYACQLFADLFDEARRAGHELVVCEVNSDSPNLASDAFHAALGFREVGRAVIHHGQKTVRYLARAIDPTR